MWGEMFMAGSGKKSETNELENKYIRRHKRLIMLVDLKHAGKVWNGYTDWTNADSFLMDWPNVPTAKAAAESLPPALSTGVSKLLRWDTGWKAMSSMSLPGWVSTGSALEAALLVSQPPALKRRNPPPPPTFHKPTLKGLRDLSCTHKIKFMWRGAASREPCRRGYHGGGMRSSSCWAELKRGWPEESISR